MLDERLAGDIGFIARTTATSDEERLAPVRAWGPLKDKPDRMAGLARDWEWEADMLLHRVLGRESRIDRGIDSLAFNTPVAVSLDVSAAGDQELASISMAIFTSSLTSTPPDSRAAFQFNPKSLRLIFVCAV